MAFTRAPAKQSSVTSKPRAEAAASKNVSVSVREKARVSVTKIMDTRMHGWSAAASVRAPPPVSIRGMDGCDEPELKGRDTLTVYVRRRSMSVRVRIRPGSGSGSGLKYKQHALIQDSGEGRVRVGDNALGN